jgi:hypothetical protein
MSKTAHYLYIFTMSAIVVTAAVLLIYFGYSYYATELEQRFFDPLHPTLKPSGAISHGLGIAGSLFMMIGVFIYMVRKRLRSLSRLGVLKHWLEFHIFLCTLGPLLVLFHTAFKFGGIVAISFWSMVMVFLSGIIGRFIYIQIPRTIEGRELSLNEVRNMKKDIGEVITDSIDPESESYRIITESVKRKFVADRGNLIALIVKTFFEDRETISRVRKALKQNNLKHDQYKKILDLVKNEISLNRRIDRLQTMQNLFKYWHVAHLPFAIVMLIIMLIHVGVTITFGYRWIF